MYNTIDISFLEPPPLRRSYKTICEICSDTCFVFSPLRKGGLCHKCKPSLIKLQRWFKKRLKIRNEFRKKYAKELMEFNNNVSKDITTMITNYL